MWQNLLIKGKIEKYKFESKRKWRINEIFDRKLAW